MTVKLETFYSLRAVFCLVPHSGTHSRFEHPPALLFPLWQSTLTLSTFLGGFTEGKSKARGYRYRILGTKSFSVGISLQKPNLVKPWQMVPKWGKGFWVERKMTKSKRKGDGVWPMGLLRVKMRWGTPETISLKLHSQAQMQSSAWLTTCQLTSHRNRS